MIIGKIGKLMTMINSLFYRRNKEISVFGSWYGEKFADNPKYLYLYYLKQGKAAYWITKNTDVYNSLKEQKLPVIMFDSKEGKRISKRAKYFFYCCSLYDINKYYAAGAVMINLWHGVPLKKIMYDDVYSYNTGKASFYDRMTEIISARMFSNKYVVTTSRTISEIYKSAFRLDGSRILNLGQPRNDCFFDSSIPRVEYSNIPYSKLITYMPTMRNMGKSTIEISELLDLERLDDLCRKHNTLFLIKKHFCHRNEHTDLDKYTNIVDLTNTFIDTQELLFNTDYLITDYSSCYIDYLLLERPIIFYAYDLSDYLQRDREMYFKYSDVTPGEVVETFPDLYNAIEKLFNQGRTLDDRFARVRDLFYDPQNRKVVSPSIMDAVEKL